MKYFTAIQEISFKKHFYNLYTLFVTIRIVQFSEMDFFIKFWGVLEQMRIRDFYVEARALDWFLYDVGLRHERVKQTWS